MLLNLLIITISVVLFLTITDLIINFFIKPKKTLNDISKELKDEF